MSGCQPSSRVHGYGLLAVTLQSLCGVSPPGLMMQGHVLPLLSGVHVHSLGAERLLRVACHGGPESPVTQRGGFTSDL